MGPKLNATLQAGAVVVAAALVLIFFGGLAFMCIYSPDGVRDVLTAEGRCYSSWDQAYDPRWAHGQCSILQADYRVPTDVVGTYSYGGVKAPHLRD